MNCLKAWQHYLGFHKTKVFTNNVSLRYFETQPRAMAKELHWHDTLALMDIELIHKHGKNNVVPYVLNRMEEYQRGMHWESIQILRTMFVEKSDIKRKIQKAYVEDCLAQSYFNDLRQKKKVKRITILDGLLKWKRSQVYVPEGKLHTKVMQEMHDVPMVEHCGEKTTRELLGKIFY